MTTNLKLPAPSRFDLQSFADLLPDRAPIIGEGHLSFEGFHTGMMQSLLPMTPYEGVIAENLIAIEWELLQHRRMRDASLRQLLRDQVTKAVVAREEEAFEEKLDDAWDQHMAKGGSEDDWKEPFTFDEEAASKAGQALAKKAVSQDRDVFQSACAEIEDMGLDVVELMGEAYRTHDPSVIRHEHRLPALERRRREVMRDYEALQKARPLDLEVAEAEVI